MEPVRSVRFPGSALQTPEHIKVGISEEMATPDVYQVVENGVTPEGLKVTVSPAEEDIIHMSSPEWLENLQVTPEHLDGVSQVDTRGQHSKRCLLKEFDGKNPEQVASKPKRGRPSYHDQFPRLVQVATDFLEERGLAAHNRRRETTTQAIGCSANDIRLHLVDQIEDLPLKFSASTVRRLMQPPNKARTAAKLYKHVIDARVGKKENSLTKEHPNSHYLKCRVKYAMELAALHSDEIEIFSADAKDKLKLGGPVVSRHVKVKAYSLIRDDQQIPDHDFPVGSGYKFIPDGYMNLKEKTGVFNRRRCRSLDRDMLGGREGLTDAVLPAESRDDLCIGESDANIPASGLTVDSLGRTHLKCPRTGPVLLKLRAQKYNTATNYNHLLDLRQYIMTTSPTNRQSIIIVCDNGPDWNKSSVKTLLCMGRLWRDLHLDYLDIFAYAPGDSKYNMIEHAWAPVTNWLSQLVTSAVLPGEDRSPLQQKLPDHVLREKELRL